MKTRCYPLLPIVRLLEEKMSYKFDLLNLQREHSCFMMIVPIYSSTDCFQEMTDLGFIVKLAEISVNPSGINVE